MELLERNISNALTFTRTKDDNDDNNDNGFDDGNERNCFVASINDDDIIKRNCEIVNLPKLDIGYSFSGKLRRLQREYHWVQHQLAYLSTMGGANHLCNRPLVALEIARKQEQIGKRIGSTSLQIRAKVFQAVNYGLLGYKKTANKMFMNLLQEANDEGWPSLIKFIEASMIWLKMEFKSQKKIQKTICN